MANILLLICTVIGAVASLVSAFVAVDEWRKHKRKGASTPVATLPAQGPQEEAPELGFQPLRGSTESTWPPSPLEPAKWAKATHRAVRKLNLHKGRERSRLESVYQLFLLGVGLLVCTVVLVCAIIADTNDLQFAELQFANGHQLPPQLPPAGSLSYKVLVALTIAGAAGGAAFIAALDGLFGIISDQPRGSRGLMLTVLWISAIGVIGMALVINNRVYE
jgi:hypothetical protein